MEIKENPSRTTKSKASTQRPALQSINAEIPKRQSSHFSEYSNEIIQVLMEEQTCVKPSYMDQQTDIDYKMRAIVVDWLVSVHNRFKMRPETLYLSISLIDRYLQTTKLHRKELQLAGVASLFLASKYEEIHPPHLKNFVFLTDKAYTRTQVINMESRVLRALDYQLSFTTAWTFLEGFVGELHPHSESLAKYLLELSLLEYHMLKYPPSLQAASALFLAVKLIKKDSPSFDPGLGHPASDVKACAKDMLVLMQAAPKHPLKAVREKYSHKAFCEVAKIRLS